MARLMSVFPSGFVIAVGVHSRSVTIFNSPCCAMPSPLITPYNNEKGYKAWMKS